MDQSINQSLVRKIKVGLNGDQHKFLKNNTSSTEGDFQRHDDGINFFMHLSIVADQTKRLLF